MYLTPNTILLYHTDLCNVRGMAQHHAATQKRIEIIVTEIIGTQKHISSNQDCFSSTLLRSNLRVSISMLRFSTCRCNACV